MSLPFHADAFQNPFLGNTLLGAGEQGGLAPYPVSFSVERETDRTWALRLVPLGVTPLAAALGVDPRDRLLLLSTERDQPAPRPPRSEHLLVPATALSRLRAPLEAIHVSRGAMCHLGELSLPGSILSDPDAALPEALGSRYAFSIQDGCHGVVYSPDPSLLRDVLRQFMRHLQLSVLGRPADLPPIPDDLIDPFMEPLPPDTFRELSFNVARSFWVMETRLRQAGCELSLEEPLRWVAEGEGGRWRANWSW